MKRAEVLAMVADLAGDDITRQADAVRRLESLPLGYLEDHALPKSKVVPHLPRLASLLSSDCPDSVKEWCAQLMGESGIKSQDYLQSLIAVLTCKSERVLMSAIWAIGTYRDAASPAIDSLYRLVSHSNPEVRWRAVWALAEIGPKGQQFAERFAALFDDPERLVRGYSVCAFVTAATPSGWAIEQLRRAAHDDDPMPRGKAEQTLKEWERRA